MPKQPDTARFELFWQNYPRKVDKSRAYAAWLSALRGIKATKNRLAQAPVSESDILIGLAQYLFSDDLKFVPHPATWLNNRRWENIEDSMHRTTSAEQRTGSTWRDRYDDLCIKPHGAFAEPADWRPAHTRPSTVIQGEFWRDE